MCDINSFGIIGGDKRQLYCGDSIGGDGYSVSYCGFGDSSGHPVTDLQELIRRSDALILPLPCTRDGVTVSTPLSEEKILLEDVFSLAGNKPVFCGMKHKLKTTGGRIFDYSIREDFAVANAVPTAEGAIGVAIKEYDGVICGSSCLVTGYGRIGRVLSSMLRGMGADVAVSARKQGDLAFIRAAGMKAVRSDELHGKYDLIFNTVPFMLFDARTLAKTAVGALLIDLASLPGGVDLKAAGRLSVKTVQALSLPGKTAPKASGIIIKNAVYNIIEEENL